jgi:hypothetical protein
MLEHDPEVQAEIQEARAAYEAEDFVTIDEYIAQLEERGLGGGCAFACRQDIRRGCALGAENYFFQSR